MKKLLMLLSMPVLGTSMLTPILLANTLIGINNIPNNNSNDSYKSYQPQSQWFEYIKDNLDLQETILEIMNKNNQGYTFDRTEMDINTVPTTKNQPIGTLLMNGEIQTTSGSPNIVTKHIIDNSQGENPITVDYDANQIETSSTVNASISSSFKFTIGTETKMSLFFASASVKTSLEFNVAASLSTSKTVASTVTFDKFSTTVEVGKKEQVDYIVMQNTNVFNMVLKAKTDFTFYFKKGSSIISIKLSELNKYDQYRDLLASYLYLQNQHQGYDKGFIELEPIFNDKYEKSYTLNNTYTYIPLTFVVDGYSTIIKQTKL